MVTITSLHHDDILLRLHSLNALLIDCVEGGASVSFVLPMGEDKARVFWEGVAASVARDGRQLLVALDDQQHIIGCVILVTDLPENQPHRAEVAKLLVHSRARRGGIARALMARLEQEARAQGRWLLVLDTASGSGAEQFYRRCGWQQAGVIPDYALMPDGARCSTTLFWKHLAAGSPPGR
ncbi:GNAT family N-acetyltransferase [Shimwellia pseudoproteus]|uniref:GNAT family N-acetyltransferase n=1 Tax=Shimwellia pseudoproteus TaxID=570012 RepID=UPI0018ECE04B|nr:GNAT family N-acetyltransferase [Shimwellia pseudoproteus]MBJ3813694.1 GNAT family N-acetyltransferase [Shimwellia pseudoproteus]